MKEAVVLGPEGNEDIVGTSGPEMGKNMIQINWKMYLMQGDTNWLEGNYCEGSCEKDD